MTLRRAASVLLLAVCTLTAGSRASGQAAPGRSSVQPELRVDAIASGDNTVALQLGLGAELPLGYYARAGIIGAGGATFRNDVTTGSGRADVLVRFLLDPFRETSWGISAGAGLSVRYEPILTPNKLTEFLVAVIDVEGPRMHRIVPAVQVGLGGGWRAGLVLRAYRQGRR
jgi:hypothetical protein